MSPRLALLAIFALLVANPTSAQDAGKDYPNRAIKIIVSVPAGGGIDSITRIVAEKLRQRWHQPVTVENKGGQAGNIGSEAVFTAEPDGYTLLATVPAPLIVNAALYNTLRFDPTAFVPVSVMTIIPNALTVRPGLPVSSAREFLDYAKAHPGQLNYASQGNGTTSHLAGELLQRSTGLKLVHVPYKGTAPAINDLIGDHVDLMFLEMAAASGLQRAGHLKILALATQKRIATYPDIPTLAEVGVPNFQSETWNVIMAPPKTPPAIAAKLNAAINDALNEPDIRKQLDALSARAGNMSPAEVAKFIEAERTRWTDVVKAAGIKIE
ncbi:MAG TPA: tripartite tricarboxylate transporter substrate binding protein [Pseudolabrys sp.]|nr:tripartite tricarboxylate transporter substrate binding protein [Pseudolabrys sp.]